MSEEIRGRILGAASRVYSQYGFRGATTRLIAAEAGVNEVTLFRTFGSKAQLLQAMLSSHTTATAVPVIVDTGDPRSALLEWCRSVLQHLRTHAHIIRKTIAEAEERPDAACAACEGSNSAGASLVVYLERLREDGLVDAEADVETAVSMFMSALFGDALYRDIMPQAFLGSADEAATRYVETFMRAVGLRATSLPDRSRQRVAGSRRRSR
jgi:AcrR family transcriptional regulator